MVVLGIWGALWILGCQPKVYLMPTPAILATGELNPFAINPDLATDNRVPVFYATNRIPFAHDFDKDRYYWIFPDNKLHLGMAELRIGDPKTPWELLFRMSTSDIKEKRPALELQRVTQMVSLPVKDSLAAQALDAKPFLDAINTALATSPDKDIMVYVHGANSNFYRASAQAAQYRHFTGRNSVVLAFLWPSAENILAYGTDVRHARKSVPAFARFIKLLSTHTDARYINILAYSAGSQIVSPSLARVGREIMNVGQRDALRLGEVYFAAGDVGLDTFVDNLRAYYDIPRAVTVTINPRDSVLGFAAFMNRVSRVGRPDAKDLDQEALDWVTGLSHTERLHLIGVSSETVPGMLTGSHDFWYAHPWISSDVLVQFLFHADPQERGLAVNQGENGGLFWTFPADYATNLIETIKAAAAEESQSPKKP